MRISLSTVARECDRSGVSDSSAAKIASAVLNDIGMITENETSNIIDRSKIRRERSKNRISLQQIGKTETKTPQTIYFDGRKDKTMKMEKCDTKYYKRTILEEHIVLIQEPESKYVGHVTPKSGTAENCAKSILQ